MSTPTWGQLVPPAHATGDGAFIAPDWNLIRAAFLEVRSKLQNVAVTGDAKDLTGSIAGLPTARVVPQTGSYILSVSDLGVHVEVTSGSPVVITVPTEASVPLPVGAVIEVVRVGAGSVTVAAATGVTLQSPTAALTVRAQFSSVRLRKRASNTWIVSGDLTPDAGGSGGGGTSTTPSALLSDAFTGATWDASKWTTGGNFSFSVAGGAGRMTSVNSAGWHGEAKAVISNVMNVGVLHRIRVDANGHILRTYLRGLGTIGNYGQADSGFSGVSTSYDNTNGTVQLQSWSNGSSTTPTGAGTVQRPLSAGVWYWWRTEAVGSTLRTRLWPDGSSEPSGWDVSGSVGVTPAGGVWLTDAMYLNDAGWVVDFDDVTIYAAS